MVNKFEVEQYKRLKVLEKNADGSASIRKDAAAQNREEILKAGITFRSEVRKVPKR